MKKIIILLLLTIPLISFAQKEVIWDYPVKPGSEEWRNLSNEKDRFQAQQIPTNIIAKIPTDKLVKSCINLPSFGHYTAYKNIQTGFIILAIKFNGLKELSKRKDAMSELVKIYQTTGEHGFSSSIKGINSSYWSLRLGWVEVILSQRKFLEQRTPSELKDLMKTCIEKYNMKQKSNRFSMSGTESTFFLMARILDFSKYQAYEVECNKEPNLKEFSETSRLFDSDIYAKILDLSLQFVKN